MGEERMLVLTAEAMHWELGEHEMASRAGRIAFTLIKPLPRQHPSAPAGITVEEPKPRSDNRLVPSFTELVESLHPG